MTFLTMNKVCDASNNVVMFVLRDIHVTKEIFIFILGVPTVSLERLKILDRPSLLLNLYHRHGIIDIYQFRARKCASSQYNISNKMARLLFIRSISRFIEIINLLTLFFQLVATGQFTIVKQPLGFIKVLQWVSNSIYSI